MGDFFQFYANGGIFMHVITLTTVAAVSAVVLHKRADKKGSDAPRYLQLADRLTWLGVAIGLLGSLFGLFDFCAALQSIPAEDLAKAAARGMGLVPTTMAWALMVAIPLWCAVSILRVRQPVPAD